MSLAVVVLIVLAVLGLLWLIYNLVWGTPPTINLAVERLGLRMLLADPETLSYVGLLDNTLLDFHSGRLTDASPRYMQNLRRLDQEGLNLIRRYDSKTLLGQDDITCRLMRWYYDQNLRGHRFDYHYYANPVFMGPYPVNHVFGVQVDLINFLSTYHKIRGRRSIRRYLERLEAVPWKLSGLVESLVVREKDGVIPPRFVIEKSLTQVRDFLAGPVTENPLYASFVERMAAAGRYRAGEKARWAGRVLAAVEANVLPAYRELGDYLEGLLEKAGEEDGIWRLPEGEAYYAFLLRMHTTTDLTAEAIHQLGLAEVARLTAEIREVLAREGLPAETPGQQLRVLMETPDFHYPEEPERRQKIIDDYQAILDEVNRHMPALFHFGSLDEIIVKRLPAYKEPDSPIAYAQAPAMDGSRPGTMWINLREPDNVYQWGMRTLAYHEGIPGHIYQMAQAQKIDGLPTFRRTHFFNAYVEGWALYAERLGWELGLEDAYSNLGRLQALLWRAVRLVVDTGIHVKRWSREEAIDYMAEKTGLPMRDVITEVERYIVMPGQACAYYIGYLRMLAFRQKAESTLGDSFDLRAFHDVLIRNGGLPLTLLESVVNDFVDRAAGLEPVRGRRD
jgi:uncharacterized protein (DUF885 family)